MKNELITKAATKITCAAGKTGLTLKKYSPEILFGVGIAAIIGGTVLACRATLKIDDILAEHEEMTEKMERGVEELESYTEEDYKKDNAIQTIKTGFKIVKLYAPAAVCMSIGIASLLGSHHILKSRNLALMAAYNVLNTSFDTYRDRVRKEQGEDKDLEYLHGVKDMAKSKTTIDENGNPKDPDEKDMIPWSEDKIPSTYAKFFDETSVYWQKNAELNKIFINCQQNHANDLLNTRGHVFLNEVYDLLGLTRTKEGAVVGWVKSPGGQNFIDFGLYNTLRERNRDFINGYERSVLLDFNVDGVIYDKI